MKALIVLENHFYVDNENKVWCDRVVDYNYLKRYLNVFESIIIAGRTKRVVSIFDDKLFCTWPKKIGLLVLYSLYHKTGRGVKWLCAKNFDCVVWS